MRVFCRSRLYFINVDLSRDPMRVGKSVLATLSTQIIRETEKKSFSRVADHVLCKYINFVHFCFNLPPFLVQVQKRTGFQHIRANKNGSRLIIWCDVCTGFWESNPLKLDLTSNDVNTISLIGTNAFAYTIFPFGQIITDRLSEKAREMHRSSSMTK